MQKLFLCLLALIGFQSAQAQLFTKGDVYDFEIGDEFHYRHEAAGGVTGPPYTKEVIRVLNKYSSPTHLYYEMGNIDLNDSTNVLNTYVDSFLLTSLNDPVIDTSSLWNFNDTIFSHDTTITNPNFYGGMPYQRLFFTKNLPHGYEPPTWFHSFVKGCGEVNYYRSQQNGALSRSLVYSKKGSVIWGASLFTGISEISSLPSLEILPNPFINQLELSLSEVPSTPIFFELYNAVGKLVLKEQLQETNTIIKVNEQLPLGVYYGILNSKKEQHVIQLVKQ